MTQVSSPVNQAFCQIREIDYTRPTSPCDRCQRLAESFTTAERVAIDLHLKHPVLLLITVSVHYCPSCNHYFRAQPPFLRPSAIYTNRVVDKAVQSVYGDGMAMRRVTVRMARDFWVQPSEGIIRQWCRAYGAQFDFETDYQPWVVSEFSGILCVDEVYQDRLALLLAVDPAAPEGDRIVGYQLIHGSVNSAKVECFLERLKQAGIEPDEVVTDGSTLYPSALAKVWPQVAHQLCLFHETRRVTKAVMKAINAIRKSLPQPPPKPGTTLKGPLYSQPPRDDSTYPATQRWYWRQVQRRDLIAHVHELAQQGLSGRAISRQTGHHRETVKKWLQQPVPPLPEGLPAELSDYARLPARQQRKEQKQKLKQRIHALAEQGLSYSEIARRVGIHRVTVKKWLQESLPIGAEEPDELENEVESVPPPESWSSWDQVRQAREDLQEHRFLLLRRPENLRPEDRRQVNLLLSSPVGSELKTVRSFLEDWYCLWTNKEGQRRSLAESQARYETWREHSDYGTISQLRRIQTQMTPAKFERLSQFLRRPEWEATNNGAERAGRAFRHLQAPHFNLRNKVYIEQAITVTACLRKEAATRPPAQPFHTCQRGRKPHFRPCASVV